MANRDYLLNGIENITLIIAKLMGLKKDGDIEEFVQLYTNCLVDDFNVDPEKSLELTDEDFKLWLENKNYGADKLDSLAKMIYLRSEIFRADTQNTALLQKVIVIFDLLEQKYHQQSFENINRRKLICQLLNQKYE